MRKTMWTLAVAAVALGGALAFTGGDAAAGGGGFAKKICGVYRITYSITGLGSFQGFLTLNEDGTTYATDWNDQGMPSAPALGGAKNGVNHGAWNQTGKKSLDGFLVCFVYSAAGDPVGVQVTQAVGTTEDYDTFSYTMSVKTYSLAQDFEDPAVTPAMGTLSATGAGHRLDL
jgi:hypothetical protein